MIAREIKQKLVERSLFALWWLIVGSAALWMMVGSVAYWVKNGWLPADTAGWVQAIGGLGAIVGAFVITRLEEGRRRSEKAWEQYGVMSKAYSAGCYAVFTLINHQGAFSGQAAGSEGVCRLSLKLLRAAYHDMEAVGVSDISDLAVARVWADLRRSVRLVIATMEETIDFALLTKAQAQGWVENGEEDIVQMEAAIKAFAGRFPGVLV